MPPYFNFNYVTNPPSDELVDETTQLNNNWSEVDNKLDPYNKQPTTLVSPPIGTEALYPSGVSGDDSYRMAVWNGTTWSRVVNYSTVWGAWTSLGIRSPRNEHPSYPCRYRVDEVNRRVVLQGAVRYDGSSGAWPNSNVEITTDTALSLTYEPVGAIAIKQQATSSVVSAGGFNSAVVYVQKLTGPDRLAVNARWQGNSGGGNYVVLDGFTWWY